MCETWPSGIFRSKIAQAIRDGRLSASLWGVALRRCPSGSAWPQRDWIGAGAPTNRFRSWPGAFKRATSGRNSNNSPRIEIKLRKDQSPHQHRRPESQQRDLPNDGGKEKGRSPKRQSEEKPLEQHRTMLD